MGTVTNEAGVDQAIRRVLAAEAASEERVRAAEREAFALREAARADARAVATRTERRIGALRQRFEALTQREVARLDAQCVDEPASAADGGFDAGQLARAVAAVAAELTGAEP